MFTSSIVQLLLYETVVLRIQSTSRDGVIGKTRALSITAISTSEGRDHVSPFGCICSSSDAEQAETKKVIQAARFQALVHPKAKLFDLPDR